MPLARLDAVSGSEVNTIADAAILVVLDHSKLSRFRSVSLSMEVPFFLVVERGKRRDWMLRASWRYCVVCDLCSQSCDLFCYAGHWIVWSWIDRH